MPDDEEIDTRYTRDLVCPYCGHVETDSWEMAAGGVDGDVGTTNCGECDREYEYTINVDITYCISKMED
jgi:transcription elongation factor Elf1